MKKEVIKRLGYTQQQYEDMLMTLWLNWCDDKTTSRKSLQKALICRPLYHWWLRELAALEGKFIYETDLHAMDLDQSTALALYISHTRDIYSLLSKPLLKKANRKTAIYGSN